MKIINFKKNREQKEFDNLVNTLRYKEEQIDFLNKMIEKYKKYLNKNLFCVDERGIIFKQDVLTFKEFLESINSSMDKKINEIIKNTDSNTIKTVENNIEKNLNRKIFDIDRDPDF